MNYLVAAVRSGLLLALAICANAAQPDAAMRRAVEEDWARQEQRWGRAVGSKESICEAVARAARLLESRQPVAAVSDRRDSPRDRQPAVIDRRYRAEAAAKLAEFQRAAEKMDALDDAGRLALYHRARWFARELALSDPRVTGQPLVFMKRNRFVCQMLHEYMGYFQDYGNVAGGGGVFVLERPGYSLKTRDLIRGRLANGNFTTLALSFNTRTVFFAFAERSEKKPEFTSPERRSFHIFSMAGDGSALRQLTRGVEDDFDPCPLPDGGVAFMSSRRGGFARCNNAWEPCETYTLHRMDADGANIRTLSFHETDEWHPFVMNDGRLVFIRWDYVDRSAANFHGLWTSRADGTGVAGLFGNYTMRINACYQPRPIPGSDKLLFLAGAHHADVGGSLVMLDPKRARLDAKTGEDILDATLTLTPEICFPESAGWPKSYFHSPWPLSEDAFLVSFSFDPLPGMSSGEKKDTRTGLYYFDRFGNLELLYRDADISSMYPIPFAPRGRPPVVGSNLALELGDEGEFLLSDVKHSLMPLPPNRPIRELRVFQLLAKTGTHTANNPRIGHANAENARLLLGTVPVEADGSAYFRAPAGKPLYFQAVDATGRAVQSMRSEVYLQPGERRACVGCHEAPGTAAANRPTLAMRRAPSRLQPGPDGTRPMSYPLLVQPVLDRHCVRCHNGKSKLALTGEAAGNFTRSYQNLKPHLRWYEWGGASISQIATQPGRIGADTSPLTAILDDATHRGQVQLPDADRRQLYLWLDANVPFYGTYDHAEQLAQREGRSVPVPLSR
jgi:hypothetical protein